MKGKEERYSKLLGSLLRKKRNQSKEGKKNRKEGRMSVPSSLLRRRTSSHGETERKSFLFDEESEGEDGFRRRVVSFTSPETSNASPTTKSKGYSEQRNGDQEQRYAGPRGDLLLRSQVSSSSGEDIPNGIIKSKKGGNGGEDVPDGVGGGIGGFRRRLKSMSFGISLSPGSSSHDIRHPPEATAGGGTAGGAGGGGVVGGIVNSMVRRSLLQAVWPLSVSLENIEGHYHPLQQHR